MKRFVFAMLVGALLLFAAGPASAQYEEPPDEEPQQPRTVANVSDDVVSPGDPVNVTVPPASFAPGTPIVVQLARAQQGAGGVELATGTAGSNGAASQVVTIPATQNGVYFLYVTGVDSDGNPVVAIVAIVIEGGTATAAAVESNDFAAAAAFTTVPAPVAQVQSGLTPDTEAAVVEAVTQQGAGLVLSPEGTLNVRTPAGVQSAGALPTTGSDGIATQTIVGAALLLAGTGLVLLRRRGGFAK